MRFKLLSYNIHKGFDLLGRWTLEDMRQALRTTEVDALLLQEVVGENKKLLSKFKNSSANEKQFEFLADEVWPHFSYGRNAVFPSKHHGNAILSRFPIIGTENTDLTVNRLEFRGLLYAKIEYGSGKFLHLCTTHLNLFSSDRRLQILKICNWIQNNIPKTEPMILAGDFNDWNQELSAHLANNLGLAEAFQSKYSSYARSFPSISPWLCLDRVYYRNMRILDAAVLVGMPWLFLSDHLPLLVEVELPRQ